MKFQMIKNLKYLSRIPQGQTQLIGLSNSLRCLVHPSVIASVALLLINDHLLKHYFPSPLTGKLSDFAGLYFFPFIIALLLSLLLNSSEKRMRLVGRFSFLLVAAFFIMIKTVPWVNDGIESVLSSLTGKPSVILLDGSDLIALTILIPSWRLWNRGTGSRYFHYGWLVFGVASLASVATSCPPGVSITHLFIEGGAIYAAGSDAYALSVSYDKGLTWEDPLDVPDELLEQINLDPALPQTTCDAEDSNQCFRVSGQGIVERSRDGGVSWEIAWQVPPGRRRIMDRLASGLVCGKRIDLGPYDVELMGNREARVVVVAMGNEGVMVGDMDGGWTRQQVGFASPTPFAVENPFDVLWVLLEETAILLAGVVLGWVFLNWLYWKPVLRELDAILPRDRGGYWMLKPLRGSILLMLVLIIGSIILEKLTGLVAVILSTAWPLILVVFLIPIAGQIGSWRRLKASVPNPEEAGKALEAITLGTIAILAFGFAPFLLWSLGAIAHYSVALTLSIVLTLIVLVLAARQIGMRARTSIEAPL